MDPMGIMGLMGWNDGVLWGLMGLNIYIYIYIYLVGGFNLPLWEIWVCQLGWFCPIFGKIQNVPNHQPDIGSTWFNQLKTGIPQGITAWWWLIPQRDTVSGRTGRVTPWNRPLEGWPWGEAWRVPISSQKMVDSSWQYGISQTLVQTQNDQYKIATLFPVDESRKKPPWYRLQLHQGLTRHDYV